MPTAHDVAAYILAQAGRMTAMKLEKLAFYSQAWSLVWDERPMFDERIEAWANGPVVVDLYEKHRGQFEVEAWPWGNAEELDDTAKETVDAVIGHYNRFTAQQLSDLTHQECPWKDAREGVPDGERSNHEITQAAMHEYYSGL